ncbi:MAG: DUF3078 domain-containing protein [Salinivirgaceae bacterium]|nr:DUF3078 domain-containing protein [Salinivirgaceae bacterium]MDD4745711.1 DUF3078 domain-containing protein [Salinivirgaceae bacterium]MDY0280055.1 DUF3078 domain-containing protein [Salinivirgaceae bacterium]
MKIKLITFVLLFSTSIVSAQVLEAEALLKKRSNDSITGWKYGGVLGANLNQTSLTNWAAGGEESFSITGMASLFANYKNKKDSWTNSLDIGYGILKQGDENNSFMKTDDKIDLLSKYGRKAFTRFYYSALVNAKTQMTNGYNYPNDSISISGFWAPAYLISAVGMDYKPNDYFSVFAAPITSKFTWVNNQRLADEGSFGVDPAEYVMNADSTMTKTKDGKNTKSEVGGYIRIIYSKGDFKNEWLKNVSFTTKLDLFSNYLKNPECIDVNWETQLVFKINKFLNVNLSTHLIYDDDITYKNEDGSISGPKIQFKEILGVGIAYKF